MKSPKVVDKTFYDLLSENAALAKNKVPEGNWDLSSLQDPGLALKAIYPYARGDLQPFEPGPR